MPCTIFLNDLENYSKENLPQGKNINGWENVLGCYSLPSVVQEKNVMHVYICICLSLTIA